MAGLLDSQIGIRISLIIRVTRLYCNLHTEWVGFIWHPCDVACSYHMDLNMFMDMPGTHTNI